ncbi:hypothetical protein HYT18_00415 [Candidatus Microgenomates bacterium]|nr:hypothetical protein [Candidatus Microgenomates bacterium]
MSEIPLESQNLIKEFLAQQVAEEQEREKQKQACKRVEDRMIRKPMTAREVQRYAKDLGFSVESGKGRHGIHLVSADGRECPLPVHGRGRTLANGTQHSIMTFINQNGASRA